MRRWIWRTLLAAAVTAALAALTVGVFAAPGDPGEIWTGGVRLELDGAEWTVVEYDGETEEVIIPALYENKPVTKIASTAFNNGNGTDAASNTLGKKLNQVTIPGTVKTVAAKAFMGCESLNTVVFQDYMAEKGIQRNATIETSAFEGCNGLVTLKLSCNIVEIQGSAFKDCKHLSGIVIPWGVKKIQQNAFLNCGNLQDITILDPVVDIDKAFNLDSTILKTVHAVEGSELYGKLANRLSTSPGKLHGLTGNTEPVVRVAATCTRAGSIEVSFKCDGYTTKETYKETITGPDGTTSEKEVVKDVHHDCGYYTGKGPVRDVRVTSILPHTAVKMPDEEATCSKAGSTGGEKCANCPAILVEPVPVEKKPHTYLADGDADGQVEVEEVFPGQCKGEEKGLSMVTKKCAVCGYAPICWKCRDLIWRLEEAEAGLADARKDLADANAALKAAAEARDQAQAERDAADKARTEAAEAKTKAEAPLKEAQEKTAQAQEKLDALGADAPEEEVEAAKKALEEAKAKEEEAERAFLALDRAEASAGLALKKAEEKLAEATDAFGKAEKAQETAEGAVENDTSVPDARTDLRTHLADKTGHEECGKCVELLEAVRAAKNESAKEKAEEAYEQHQSGAEHQPDAIKEGVIQGKDSDKAPEHDWGEAEVPDGVTVPVCGSGKFIVIVPKHTCKVCGATKDGEEQILDARDEHKLPANPEVEEEKSATCTEDGKIAYKDYTCEVCKTLIKGEVRIIHATGHKWVDAPDEIIKEPTCTEGGLKNTYQKCVNENCPLKGEPQIKEENVATDSTPLGHKWGEFVPNTGEGSREEPTCGKAGWVLGTVTCTVCGETVKDHKVTLEATGQHEYGEWKVTKEPADGEDGTRERECKVCLYKDIQTIPAGNVPDKPTDPDQPTDPDNPDKPDKPDKPEEPKSYRVDVVTGPGGSASASRTTAQSGVQVTITVTPDSGYEVDMVRAIRGGTSVVSLSELGGGQYRLTMPADNVEVRISFERKSSGPSWSSAPGDGTSGDPRRTTDVMPTQNPTQSVPTAGASEQRFRDVPMSHWAAGEIEWANRMGYMNGTGGRFNPDGNITHQQMWMVLARLTGSNPAGMADARRWAVEHSFADGSSPEGAVVRHQLVTALYRCAHLMGSSNRNTTSLAGYADSRTVPLVARDAFSWAVANGILGGTANSRLNPNGTLTRAQFAVILYRYSQRI